MNNLYKTIGIGVLSLPLILNGCVGKKANSEEKTFGPRISKLEGTVISERYLPARIGGVGHLFEDRPSKYIFSIDTKYGRKVIDVLDWGGTSKEELELLINKDTKVEINIPKEYNGYAPFETKVKSTTSYMITSTDVKVLE